MNRSLDEEVPMVSSAAEKANAANGAANGDANGAGATRSGSRDGIQNEEGRCSVMPGIDSLHMTSVPPQYWIDRVGVKDSMKDSMKRRVGC